MSEKEAPKMLAVEINGEQYQAKPGQTIIQVADANGIYIPRFCYHKKLSVAANCRMCLVDVENARRPSPACATPVMDGMKVSTKSEKTLNFQKSVMEFLLINHPLDCPICDQGGECELQDISMGYGGDVSKYGETKRAYKNPNIGPIIATEMTRCIQCTRCVRFGIEVAGTKELGAMGRGDHTEIGTYVERTVDSEISGNMIDLCPVGALTSKPYRFRARAWELQQYSTISAGDGLGSNLYAHARRGQIMRTVPRENELVNETWIADRDRFEYVGVYAEDRVTAPMIKKNGEWLEVSWEEALDFVKVAIETTQAKDGSDKIAAVSSDNSTVEELYLLQKLIRKAGSNSIDTRLRQTSVTQGVSAGTGINCTPEEIEKADLVVLFGSNIRKEYPLLNVRVRKAVKAGAEVISFNSYDYDFNFAHKNIKVEGNEMIHAITALLKAVSQRVESDQVQMGKLRPLFEQVDISGMIEDITKKLITAKSPVILLGQDVIQNPEFAEIYALFKSLQRIIACKGGVLSFGANARGALLSGASPVVGPKYQEIDLDQHGVSSADIFAGKTDTALLFLLGNEPEQDCMFGEASIKNLEKIDIVVAMSAFSTSAMLQYADIILPTTTHYETAGTFVNLFGEAQSFKAVAAPYKQAKPAWKVMRVLGNLLGYEDFDYQTTDDVLTEIDALVSGGYQVSIGSLLPKNLKPLKFVPQIQAMASMYRNSALMRRSQPLQNTADAQWYQQAYVSPVLAEKLGIDSEAFGFELYMGDHSLGHVNVIVDEKVAPLTIMLSTEKVAGCHMYDGDVTITAIKQEVEGV